MAQSSNGRVTTVATNVASVEVLPAATDREGFMIFNDSTQVLYLRYGTGAASTSTFSVKLAAGETFESGAIEYQGAIQGIWGGADAAGKARVTELI